MVGRRTSAARLKTGSIERNKERIKAYDEDQKIVDRYCCVLFAHRQYVAAAVGEGRAEGVRSRSASRFRARRFERRRRREFGRRHHSAPISCGDDRADG